MEKNSDMQAKLIMWILHLKEEKNKKYSFMECEKNIAYIFNNYNEYKSYFVQNGIDKIDDNILEICRMITTKKGTIIALKGLCDYTIKKHKINNSSSQIVIDEIYSKEKSLQKKK